MLGNKIVACKGNIMEGYSIIPTANPAKGRLKTKSKDITAGVDDCVLLLAQGDLTCVFYIESHRLFTRSRASLA